jgi:hypothetical protein
MKAILIDPETRTVTEIELASAYPGGNRAIGADLVTIGGSFGNGSDDTVFVDDEGLLNGKMEYMFHIPGVTYNPLAGKGFIVGCDDEGASISATVTAADVESKIHWFDLKNFGDRIRLSKFE